MIKKLLLITGITASVLASQAQDIVVNRMFKLGTDNTTGKHSTVELLVLTDKLDIRNWIIKEFANSLADDLNGGKYRFNDDLFWSNLRSGTTITLREGMVDGDVTIEGGSEKYTQDIDKSDFKIDISLTNTAYMTPIKNSSDQIKPFVFTSNSEAVLIRSDDGTGSGMGYANAHHLMAWGSDLTTRAILTTDLAACKKIYAAAAGPGSGGFTYAKNLTKTMGDWTGGAGQGGRQQYAPADGLYFWGDGYEIAGTNNKTYIQSLRKAVLPVKAVNFKTALLLNSVKLSWSTVSEKNNSRFDVYRSSNSKDFSLVGSVSGNGTSDVKRDYAYQDINPLQGLNYYQLKQVDFDGTETVIYTSSAKFAMGSKGTSVYIADQTLNVSINSDKNDVAEFNLFDVNGRKLSSFKNNITEGVNGLKMNLDNSVSGLLILSVRTSGGVEKFKLIK